MMPLFMSDSAFELSLLVALPSLFAAVRRCRTTAHGAHRPTVERGAAQLVRSDGGGGRSDVHGWTDDVSTVPIGAPDVEYELLCVGWAFAAGVGGCGG